MYTNKTFKFGAIPGRQLHNPPSKAFNCFHGPNCFILNQVFISNAAAGLWTEILHEFLPDPRNEGNIPAATFRIDPIGRSIHAFYLNSHSPFPYKNQVFLTGTNHIYEYSYPRGIISSISNDKFLGSRWWSSVFLNMSS